MAPNIPQWQFVKDQPVIVPDDVMGAAAQVCADAYVRMETICNEFIAAGLTNNDPISDLPSGQALGGEFYSAWLAAYGRLKGIHTVFNNFGDAFLWAGRMYNSTDQGNADAVKKAGQVYATTNDADDAFTGMVDSSASSPDLGKQWGAALNAMVNSKNKAPDDSILNGYTQYTASLANSDYLTKIGDPNREDSN